MQAVECKFQIPEPCDEIILQISDYLKTAFQKENLQIDYFYSTPRVALRLRVENNDSKIIYSDRAFDKEFIYTDTLVHAVVGHDNLSDIFEAVVGHDLVVKKWRMVFKKGESFIYIDEITDLGHFVKLFHPMPADKEYLQALKSAQDALISLTEYLQLHNYNKVMETYKSLLLKLSEDC